MKKVIYILNLLFLTLSVFGGSVFATAPTEYIDANGETQPIKGIPPVNLATLSANQQGNFSLTGESWYYIDSGKSTTTSYLVTNNANVNIVVNTTTPITLGTYGIFVPEGASLNFWAAPNPGQDNTDEGVSLEITNNGIVNSPFIIGNTSDTGVQSWANYGSNTDFGDITFNSGSYNIFNNSTPTGMAIGSTTTSGGTITVNQEAVVNVANYNTNTASVGVGGSQKCSIVVSGGSLNCTSGTSAKPYSFVINVGGGSLTLDNQGYIACSDTSDQTNWYLKSGIVAVESQTGGTYNWGDESQWDAHVYGEVTIPTPQGVELEAPVNPTGYPDYGYGYYGSLTID